MPAAAWKQKIKKTGAKKNGNRMRKKTLAEVNQFWNKKRKQLESRCSFPDWMEKLSALLIQMTSSSHPFSYSMIMTKGKKRRKNGLFQFRKLGQENQPGSFDGFCH